MQENINKIINDKYLRESCAVILLENLSDEDGNEYYAFYAIRADLAEAFLKKSGHSKLELEKYGVILEAFPGQPSEKILNMIKESFGETTVL